MNNLRQALWAIWTMLHPNTWDAVKKTVDLQRLLAVGKAHERLLVIMVGFSGAGKSTFLNNHPRAQKMYRLSSDAIHNNLNYLVPQLQDDKSVRGHAFRVRQLLTLIVRVILTKKCMSEGIALISDSCNLQGKQRKLWLRLAKEHNYRAVIIHVVRDESEIRATLAERGQEWEGLLDTQRGLLEVPTSIREAPVYQHRTGAADPERIVL